MKRIICERVPFNIVEALRVEEAETMISQQEYANLQTQFEHKQTECDKLGEQIENFQNKLQDATTKIEQEQHDKVFFFWLSLIIIDNLLLLLFLHAKEKFFASLYVSYGICFLY